MDDPKDEAPDAKQERLVLALRKAYYAWTVPDDERLLEESLAVTERRD